MRMTKSWLALVLHLIGWESGASSLEPIIEQSEANPKQYLITFDTPLKTTLFWKVNNQKLVVQLKKWLASIQ